MTKSTGGGVAPGLSAQQLVDAVPGLADLPVEFEVDNFRSRPGASLTIQDLTELANLIRAPGTWPRVPTGFPAQNVT